MEKNKIKVISFFNNAVEVVLGELGGKIISRGRCQLREKTLHNFLPYNNQQLAKDVIKAACSAKPKAVDLQDQTSALVVALPTKNALLTTVVTSEKDSDYQIVKKELPGDWHDWQVNWQTFVNPSNQKKAIVLIAVKEQSLRRWQYFFQSITQRPIKFIPDLFTLAFNLPIISKQPIAALFIGLHHSQLLICFGRQIVWGQILPWGLINCLNKIKTRDLIIELKELFNPMASHKNRQHGQQQISGLSALLNSSLNAFVKFFSKQVKEVYLFGSAAGINGFNVVLSKQIKVPVAAGSSLAKKGTGQNYATTYGAIKQSLTLTNYLFSMPKQVGEKIPIHKGESQPEGIIQPRHRGREIDAIDQINTVQKRSPLPTLITAVGLIVLVAAVVWFYGQWQSDLPFSQDNNDKQNNSVVAINTSSSFDLRFNFVADAVNADGQRLARTVKTQINSASSTAEGFALATADLSEDEALWPTMFANDTWLIYRQQLLLDAGQDYINSVNPTSTGQITIKNLTPKKIVPAKATGEFTITATVEASYPNDLFINIPPVIDIVASSTATTTATLANEIIITGTPEGWANVRSGPGLTNKIIGKVNDGEKYEVIKQENEWYQIKLSTGDLAWVIKKYTKK